MNQTKLDIAAPVIERKCQFGTCVVELAYVIKGVYLCFIHGQGQMQKMILDTEGTATILKVTQLELPVKP